MSKGKLPKGWKITKCKDLFTQLRGITYSKEDAFSIESENAILVLRGGNVQEGKIVRNPDDVFVLEQLVKDDQKLRKGDVVIVSSTGSKNLIGKAATVREDSEKISFGAFLTLLRPNQKVNHEFFGYFYQTDFYRKSIRDLSGGVNINNIRKEHLAEIDFPLPPLPEQQRIVAKLDAVFGHLDQIEKRLESIKKFKKQLIDSLLIDNQTGNYFSPKILKDFIEEGTERIGSNWVDKFKVGVSAKDGVIELETGQKSSFENYKVVKPGDFVYNAMRINIGSIVQYQGRETAITSPDYIVFRIKHTLSPKLLLNWLKSENGILQIGSNTKGSVRSRLYFKNLANINYPIAPNKNQTEAEKLLGWYQNLELYQAEKLSQKILDLRQSVLTKAFRGELVGQEVKEYVREIGELGMVAEGVVEYQNSPHLKSE